jgi:hypothetical protein
MTPDEIRAKLPVGGYKIKPMSMQGQVLLTWSRPQFGYKTGEMSIQMPQDDAEVIVAMAETFQGPVDRR